MAKRATEGLMAGERQSRRAAASDEHIFQRIYASIAAQKLPPGTRLREDEIRAIFGVSRARIRNVFSRLAFAGVVTLQPNRGASVARPSVKEARELFVARRVIEQAIIQQAVRNMRPQDEHLLHEHIRKEEDAEVRRDRNEMIRLSGEFHLLLAQIAGNDVLHRFLVDLVTRESLVISAYETPGRPSCSNHEHRHILDALIQRDTALAARLMVEHLDAIEARLDLDRKSRAQVNLATILA